MYELDENAGTDIPTPFQLDTLEKLCSLAEREQRYRKLLERFKNINSIEYSCLLKRFKVRHPDLESPLLERTPENFEPFDPPFREVTPEISLAATVKESEK